MQRFKIPKMEKKAFLRFISVLENHVELNDNLYDIETPLFMLSLSYLNDIYNDNISPTYIESYLSGGSSLPEEITTPTELYNFLENQ